MDSDCRIKILHHSNDYLVVDKPYDMLINSDDDDKSTLQTETRNLLPNTANPDLRHDFYFVHRLDYATSGVICLALNKLSARAASNEFAKRRAKKYYLAIVHGHVEEPTMFINKSIGQDINELDGNKKMCTDDDVNCCNPKQSSTALLVLEWGLRNDKPATKILLRPGTGRRHQLRVHCHHIGHTIIGDYTYSNRQDSEPHRTFLHSLRLVLNNNVENLDIKTPDPFVSSNELNRWKPTNVFTSLDSAYAIIDEQFD
ncbi:RNA pseudouridylate synthase domain-containing protein 1-like [Aphidius gifuensis]|uniref:RNA pseudouridylate synthase domain-containing protein 1-like n=1 Tax=Aphidius gifuensis TaxID=684658 RepID=UPI001CDC403A|nr:RNA pseudouridylate synthase domain-containing protein 1-like [Aphidius gifuensis]